MTSRIHLLIGPVGAGKSTFARALIQESPAAFLGLDTWMVRLFGDDARPETGVIDWYLERRARCRDLIWHLAGDVMHAQSSVILELGLVRRAERIEAYEAAGVLGPVRVHLLDAPRDERRARVMQRNEAGGAFTQVVPAPFFEHASDAWEPPDDDEVSRWALERQASHV